MRRFAAAVTIALAAALSTAAAASLAQPAQIPFGGKPSTLQQQHSAAVAEDKGRDTIFVLKSPSFPAHTLRFVEPPGDICESHPGTRSWSGYLDVDLDALWEHEQQAEQQNGGQLYAERLREKVSSEGGKHPKGVVEHFYFWAFESRDNPKHDATVLWLNGGPGCEHNKEERGEVLTLSAVYTYITLPASRLFWLWHAHGARAV